MNIIKNVRIYDFQNYINLGYVVFDQEIIEVGDMNNFPHHKHEAIDGKNMLLLPNLVNGHSHIYSTFARGMSVPYNPTSFKEILEQLWWKLDRNLDNQMTFDSAIVSGVEYLKHGVSTIIDHHASGEIKGSLDSLYRGLSTIGLRSVLCFETSDRFDVKECIDENTSFIRSHNTNESRGLFGLHAAFTLSDETLRKVKTVLGKTPIHIHVAESIEDQEHSIKHHQTRVIKRLDSFGLINEHSIITHGLYLDDEELEIIKKRNAVITLNVTSNMNNAVGLPNYQLMKKHGIKVIIGNDGISQNMHTEYRNLFFAMHHKDKSPVPFSYDDLNDIINNTYEYASTVLGIPLGKIQKGYASDFQLIEYPEATPINQNNMFGHLLFGLFNDLAPKELFIGGEQKISNYKLNEDVMKLYDQAHKSAKKLWDKVEKEGAL